MLGAAGCPRGRRRCCARRARSRASCSGVRRPPRLLGDRRDRAPAAAPRRRAARACSTSRVPAARAHVVDDRAHRRLQRRDRCAAPAAPAPRAARPRRARSSRASSHHHLFDRARPGSPRRRRALSFCSVSQNTDSWQTAWTAKWPGRPCSGRIVGASAPGRIAAIRVERLLGRVQHDIFGFLGREHALDPAAAAARPARPCSGDSGLRVRISTASLSSTVSTGAQAVRLERRAGRDQVADEAGDLQPRRELDRAVHLDHRRLDRRSRRGSAGAGADRRWRCARRRATAARHRRAARARRSCSAQRPKPSGATTSTARARSRRARIPRARCGRRCRTRRRRRDEGRDVVVAHEHQVEREILDPRGQLVLAVLDAQAGVAQQVAAVVGEAARFLDREVQAAAVDQRASSVSSRVDRHAIALMRLLLQEAGDADDRGRADAGRVVDVAIGEVGARRAGGRRASARRACGSRPACTDRRAGAPSPRASRGVSSARHRSAARRAGSRLGAQVRSVRASAISCFIVLTRWNNYTGRCRRATPYSSPALPGRGTTRRVVEGYLDERLGAGDRQSEPHPAFRQVTTPPPALRTACHPSPAIVGRNHRSRIPRILQHIPQNPVAVQRQDRFRVELQAGLQRLGIADRHRHAVDLGMDGKRAGRSRVHSDGSGRC